MTLCVELLWRYAWEICCDIMRQEMWRYAWEKLRHYALAVTLCVGTLTHNVPLCDVIRWCDIMRWCDIIGCNKPHPLKMSQTRFWLWHHQLIIIPLEYCPWKTLVCPFPSADILFTKALHVSYNANSEACLNKEYLLCQKCPSNTRKSKTVMVYCLKACNAIVTL